MEEPFGYVRMLLFSVSFFKLRGVNKISNDVGRFAMTVVLRIAYGITVTGMDDPFLKLIMSSSESVGRGGGAGTSMVDLFPISKCFIEQAVKIPKQTLTTPQS